MPRTRLHYISHRVLIGLGLVFALWSGSCGDSIRKEPGLIDLVAAQGTSQYRLLTINAPDTAANNPAMADLIAKSDADLAIRYSSRAGGPAGGFSGFPERLGGLLAPRASDGAAASALVIAFDSQRFKVDSAKNVDLLPGAGPKPTGMLDAVLTERLNNRSIRLIAVRLDAPTPAARQALVEAVAKQSLARRQVGVPVIVVAFVDTGELAADTRAFMTGEGLATPDLAQHSPRMIEISRAGSASVFADRQLEGIVASDNEGQLNLPGGGGLGQVAVRRR